MDLLVLADRDGVVDMTIDAISRRTNVPPEIISHAIAELMRDDRSSRSHEEDGRRLVAIDSHRDWGWQIVNYEHYRNIKDDEARRTYFRDKKREQRSQQKSTSVHNGHKSPQVSNLVKDIPTLSNKVTQAEAEADTEAQKQKPSRKRATKTALSDARHSEFKEAVKAYWDFKNPGIQMPWGPMEGKQLGMWLNEAPHITLEQFKGMLRARAKSKVNHGDRPAQWIKWITSYGPGPVNEFKNTMEVNGNGGTDKTNRSGVTAERTKAARTSLAEAALARGYYSVDDALRSADPPLPGAGERGSDAGISSGLRSVSGEVLNPSGRAGGGGSKGGS